jgi:hypothetical protein
VRQISDSLRFAEGRPQKVSGNSSQSADKTLYSWDLKDEFRAWHQLVVRPVSPARVSC